MDSAALRGLLAASLEPDADNRRRAEVQLKQVWQKNEAKKRLDLNAHQQRCRRL